MLPLSVLITIAILALSIPVYLFRACLNTINIDNEDSAHTGILIALACMAGVMMLASTY